MIQRRTKRLGLRALVVDDELTSRTAEGRAARALVQELQERALEVVEASRLRMATVVVSDSRCTPS
jgi:lysine decarboxylase/arginine decarboxylase